MDRSLQKLDAESWLGCTVNIACFKSLKLKLHTCLHAENLFSKVHCLLQV
jgi:hypothetical protein